MYNVHLVCPDYFDVFIASKVPAGVDGSESLTCEIIVQIRSYMLWMYGVNASFEKSYSYIKAICSHFKFSLTTL